MHNVGWILESVVQYSSHKDMWFLHAALAARAFERSLKTSFAKQKPWYAITERYKYHLSWCTYFCDKKGKKIFLQILIASCTHDIELSDYILFFLKLLVYFFYSQESSQSFRFSQYSSKKLYNYSCVYDWVLLKVLGLMFGFNNQVN